MYLYVYSIIRPRRLAPCCFCCCCCLSARNGTNVNISRQVLGKKESCDAGTIESPKATVVTYVEQDPDFPEGCTVRDAVYGADNPLMRYGRGLHPFDRRPWADCQQKSTGAICWFDRFMIVLSLCLQYSINSISFPSTIALCYAVLGVLHTVLCCAILYYYQVPYCFVHPPYAPGQPVLSLITRGGPSAATSLACCALPICAVLFCSVLCCAMAIVCHAIPFRSVLFCAMLCFTVLHYATLRRAMLSCVMPC